MMKNSKWTYRVLFFIASLLSNVMCVYVTYRYVDHKYHTLYSAPSYVTLIYAVPFLLVIFLLVGLGIFFYRKNNR